MEGQKKELAKLPDAVSGKYKLVGFESAGIITFPGGIGEVDLSLVTMKQADEIHAIRPNILVLVGKPEKLAEPRP